MLADGDLDARRTSSNGLKSLEDGRLPGARLLPQKALKLRLRVVPERFKLGSGQGGRIVLKYA